MKKARRIVIPALALALPLVGCNKNPDIITKAGARDHNAGIAAPSLRDIKSIAEEAFVYGLPIVMNYAVMNEFSVNKNSGQYKAPFNVISNQARVFTYKDTAVVTPNSDTPYSMLWLDLRAEPMVISVPAVPKERYYSVQLVDGNTYNYGYIGTRTTGTGAGDMPNVVKVQAGYRARPLSAFLNQPAPPPPPKIDFVPATTGGIKENFFEYLDAALQFVPETPDTKALRARIARIGIGSGKSFSFKDLSLEHKAALDLAMKEGNDKVEKFLNGGMKYINGWKVGALFGDAAFYHGNWLLRAAAAEGGIYGNDGVEAMYPMTRVTASGETIDTGRHNYILTFPPGQLPPVNAFWSVTMYDGKSQLLIRNPINRYLINSPMLPGMRKNPDGSLSIFIRKESPGPDKEANWLPAPDGPVYLVMRLYWPRKDSPSILPPGQGTWRPPGVAVAP